MRFKFWQGAAILGAAAVLSASVIMGYEPIHDEPSLRIGYIPPIASSCSQGAQAVIRKYEGIRRDEVYVCESRVFDLESEQVEFVLIRYVSGEPNCIDGCVFNDYCAIVEKSGAEFPYLTRAYAEDAAILMTQQGNTLDAVPCTTRENCTEALIARKHPLTKTDVFKTFVQNEIGSGAHPSQSVFRWCE